MNFYLDPFIFAIDKDKINKKDLEDFIDKIIDWKKLIDSNWSNVYKLTETFDLLFNNNLFPLVDNIKEVVEKYNIDYIQPGEIDKIINSIFNKTPTIEESSEIYDVLIDTDNLKLNNKRTDDFIYSLKKLLVLIKLDCIKNSRTEDSNILISNDIEDVGINFETKLSIVQSDHNFDISQQFNINFRHFETYKSFCETIDPCLVWLNNNSNMCYSVAVYISLFQKSNQYEYFYLDKEPNFKFTTSFYESLRSLYFDSHEVKSKILIRAITEEILSLNMKDTHELREKKGGNSNQISQKGYNAWRRDLDYEYHMHYWKKGDELIFCDIVNHNNFKITKL